MIIIRLNGGLGNQMFQYALGKSIECRNKMEVRYDKSVGGVSKSMIRQCCIVETRYFRD